MVDSTRYTLPPDETLAILNSHLGRFLAHTDELMQECQTFGDSVRSSLETNLGKLDSTVSSAVAEAGQRAVEQLGDHIERAVGDRLGTLRQELEALVALTSRVSARVSLDHERAEAASGRLQDPPRFTSSWSRTGLALVLANLLLAALLVVGILRIDKSADGPATSAADTAPPASALHGEAPSAPPAPVGAARNALGALCRTLAVDPDPARAQAFVAASAAAWCEGSAGVVTTNVLQALHPTSAPPEAKDAADGSRNPPPPRRRKKS